MCLLKCFIIKTLINGEFVDGLGKKGMIDGFSVERKSMDKARSGDIVDLARDAMRIFKDSVLNLRVEDSRDSTNRF